jgi:hypothetical protein
MRVVVCLEEGGQLSSMNFANNVVVGVDILRFVPSGLDLAGGLPAAETRPLNFQTSPFYRALVPRYSSFSLPSIYSRFHMHLLH